MFSIGAHGARSAAWLTLLKKCSTTQMYTRRSFVNRCEEIKISINQGMHASCATSALTFIPRVQGNRENIITTATVIILTDHPGAGVRQLPLLAVATEQLLRRLQLYHPRIHLLLEPR